MTLATKTEVGIGIEFNGTSQDSLMRAYVLSTALPYHATQSRPLT